MGELPIESVKDLALHSAFSQFPVKRGRDFDDCDAGTHDNSRGSRQTPNSFPAGLIQVKLRDQRGIEVDRCDLRGSFTDPGLLR